MNLEFAAVLGLAVQHGGSYRKTAIQLENGSVLYIIYFSAVNAGIAIIVGTEGPVVVLVVHKFTIWIGGSSAAIPSGLTNSTFSMKGNCVSNSVGRGNSRDRHRLGESRR